MVKEKKGRKSPDFIGEGVTVWKNTDEKGYEYLTVQLFGKNGPLVKCFAREAWNKALSELAREDLYKALSEFAQGKR